MENSKENIEYTGYWYLPNDEKNQLFGTLQIDGNNKLRLELCGVWGSLKKLHNYENIMVINGFTKSGKKITLFECSVESLTLSNPGIPSVNYNPVYMIIGEHFKCINDIKINSVSSRYTDLSKWIRIAPFKREIQDTEKEFVLKYKLPEPRVYKLKDYTMKVNFKANMDGNFLKECTIYQKISIIFEDLREKSIESTLNLVYDFSKFLTLCIGQKVNPYDVEAVTENGNQILITWNGMRLNEDSEKTLNNILIPYQFIQDKFQECLENWYDKSEKLSPIIDYVVEAYENVFYIPMSFLKIIQAFEAFSRRMRNNCKIDLVAHENRINYIFDRIDNDDYKEWLNLRLKHSNEPSLNNRIQQLFGELDFIINMSGKEKKRISNKITLTRNYYTHFDESNKENKMGREEIYLVTKYILLGLRVLIMMELGLDKQFIRIQIDKANELWFLKDLKNEFKLKNNEKEVDKKSI